MRIKVTQYKAEHSIAPQQDRGECKVFNVRRVSLVDAVTVHVNAQDRSQGGTK
jgi:hypothetical protein